MSKGGEIVPIRWSALQVAEAMDRTEEAVNPIIEPLEQARKVVNEAMNIPNLPEYIKGRLYALNSEIERITGGVHPWSRQSFMGSIHQAINKVRNNIPQDAIEAERAAGTTLPLSL